MKVNKLLYFLLLSSIFIGGLSIAQYGLASAQKMQISYFSELKQIIDSYKSPEKTLLVLDNDDTLTMMPCPNPKNTKQCQYLGSTAWFNWQYDLLMNAPQSRFLVTNSLDGLLQAAYVIFSLNGMVYTESDVPNVLLSLSRQKVRFLVETARSNNEVVATENVFQSLSVDSEYYPNLLTLISQHALTRGPNNIASLPSPYPLCQQANTTSVVYQQGILYVSGQNKGHMLSCFLHRMQAKDITYIIFLDDTQQNVDDVYQAFLDNSQYHVTAIHYAALDQHKEAFTSGIMADAYQKQSLKRWKHINRAIEKTFIKPYLPNQ